MKNRLKTWQRRLAGKQTSLITQVPDLLQEDGAGEAGEQGGGL